ncbi:hypothetical protein [Streptomyces chartreusis]|uniref:hypothetical protein n=1 Tax=Streptomyces chartreusis TaxID=1969 RepID=UPI00363882D2
MVEERGADINVGIDGMRASLAHALRSHWTNLPTGFCTTPGPPRTEPTTSPCCSPSTVPLTAPT